VSSVACSRATACRGTVPLAAVLITPFDRAPLWAIVCFFKALDVREEAFEEDWGSGWIEGRSQM